MKNFNIFVFFRLVIGAIFAVSGIEKLIAPYQNFLYVIQGYELFASPIELMAAKTLPWIELAIGVFVILGLWLNWALMGAATMFFSFMIVVSQAIIRHLPITECGCFGELISLPLEVVLAFDTTMFLLTIFCLNKIKETKKFGLDYSYEK